MFKQRVTLILFSIVALALGGIAGAVALFITAPTQAPAMVTALLGFLMALLIPLLALLTQQTHLLVNSRMDEFKAALERVAALGVTAARAEGVAAGKITGGATADARTDVLSAEKRSENRPPHV